jgi:branched-chain amino acid transport system permease protein
MEHGRRFPDVWLIAAILNGFSEGAMIALAAVGLSLVYKGSGVLNLAQGEIGAFAFFVTYALIGKSEANGLLLLLGTVLVGAAMGMATERLIMRPLVERPPLQGTIATLGLALVLIQLTTLNGRQGFLGFFDSKTDVTGFPIPSSSVPNPLGESALKVPGVDLFLEPERVLAFVSVAVVGITLALFFSRTRFGRGVVAATSDNTVARLLGIPVRKVYRFTWAVGGALSGLTAALYSVVTQFGQGTMTLFLLLAMIAAVVGGLDSIPGAIVGGLVVGVVKGLVEYTVGAGLPDVVLLVVIVAVLALRPRGILGGAGASA